MTRRRWRACLPLFVAPAKLVPAEAGSGNPGPRKSRLSPWTPASAGVTKEVVGRLTLSSSFPRKRESRAAGNRLPLALSKLPVKVTPSRIAFLHQPKFPGSVPFLDLLFSYDRMRHRRVNLEVNQHVHAISLGESFHDVCPVFPDPTPQVAGHPDIQGPVAPACQDVETGLQGVTP